MHQKRWILGVLLLAMMVLVIAGPIVMHAVFTHGAPVFTPPPGDTDPVINPGEKVDELATPNGLRIIVLVVVGTLLAAGFATLVTREHRVAEEPDDGIEEESATMERMMR